MQPRAVALGGAIPEPANADLAAATRAKFSERFVTVATQSIASTVACSSAAGSAGPTSSRASSGESPLSVAYKHVNSDVAAPSTINASVPPDVDALVVTATRRDPSLRYQNAYDFLADVRRMNVAMTRARRKLIIIGNSATLSAHPFYQELIAHCESTGAYRSVWEEEA